jgi:hypothetical protein
MRACLCAHEGACEGTYTCANVRMRIRAILAVSCIHLNGRAVKRSSGDEEMDLGLAEGRDNDEGLHVRGQNFGSSDEIRLEVDHENKVGDSDEQNHAADKDAARPKNQISSKMRKYILNRSWRAGADSTEGADVNSSTKGAIGRATAFSATIAARRHSAFGSTARRGSKAFGSTVGRKARSGPLGALIDADDSMEIHFLNAEEARQVMRRMVPRYVSLLWTDNRSPWRKRMGGSCLNQHQKLFWFEKNGPKSLLRLIRYLLLGSVVMLTITLEVRLILATFSSQLNTTVFAPILATFSHLYDHPACRCIER